MAIELKFRAWDEEEKYMTRGNTIKGICLNANSENFEWDDKIPLMQYTGLKDKAGKEIYVSDILSDKWRVEVYQNDEGTFMVKFHNNPLKNKSMSLRRYLSSREVAGCGERDCVVIGNIYANPELLNTGV